jgi:hypothetical protein
VKIKIGILLVVVALAAAAAGAARADVPSLPAGSSWCGEADAAACDVTATYVECSDGTVWVVDPTVLDADSFGAEFCDGDYSVLQPDTTNDTNSSDSGDGSSSTLDVAATGGTDVGFGADPNIAPDPTQYVTEIQCPDGSIWAVASGDDFVCPAA